MMHKPGYFIEELEPGMSASFEKQIGEEEVNQFSQLSGDDNPIHIDEEFAKGTMFKTRIAHGILSGSLISTVLGTKLPGTGVIYLSQSFQFRAPVRLGDVVVATATVTAIDKKRRRATFACECKVGDIIVISGEAIGLVPSRDGA